MTAQQLTVAATEALAEWAEVEVLEGRYRDTETAIGSEVGEAIINVLHRTANALGVFFP